MVKPESGRLDTRDNEPHTLSRGLAESLPCLSMDKMLSGAGWTGDQFVFVVGSIMEELVNPNRKSRCGAGERGRSKSILFVSKRIIELVSRHV